MKAYQKNICGLTCVVIDSGQPCSVAVVACHGYGAPGDDLVPLGAQWIDWLGDRSAPVRFVFPAAPYSLADLGMPNARAWWPLNMQRLMSLMHTNRFSELHDQEPPGIDQARQLFAETVQQVVAELEGDHKRLVLAGFSQGAMLTLDAALRGLDQPPQLLLQMSGTLVCRPVWQPLAKRLTETQVLQSHGTSDSILPFSSAEALRDLLVAAGVNVNFMPFPGDHTIGGPMLQASASAIEQLIQE